MIEQIKKSELIVQSKLQREGRNRKPQTEFGELIDIEEQETEAIAPEDALVSAVVDAAPPPTPHRIDIVV